MRLGKRFESARRLSKNADLQVKREDKEVGQDLSQPYLLQPVLQPVWSKGLSVWRFELKYIPLGPLPGTLV